MPWLEGGVRGGIGYVDYATNQFENGAELGGAGWWVDAELGWRRGDWTFGGFFSFISHTDDGTSQDVCGNPTSWKNPRLHMYELGVRATWHRRALSLGAGVMPLVLGRPLGQEAVTYYNDQSPFQNEGTLVFSAQHSDGVMPGLELHVGYDLYPINDRVTFQLFALVEAGLAVDGRFNTANVTQPADGLGMTSARIGVGLTF